MLLFDKGRLIVHGPFDNIRERLSFAIEAENGMHGSEAVGSGSPSLETSVASGPKFTPTDPRKDEGAQKVNLRRRYGSWKVYAYYCRSAGFGITALFILFTLIEAVTGAYTSKPTSKRIRDCH